MELKRRLNHRQYLEALDRMTPAQRLDKAIELSERVQQQLLHALRRQFPEADPQRIHTLFLKQLARCHNQNY